MSIPDSFAKSTKLLTFMQYLYKFKRNYTYSEGLRKLAEKIIYDLESMQCDPDEMITYTEVIEKLALANLQQSYGTMFYQIPFLWHYYITDQIKC